MSIYTYDFVHYYYCWLIIVSYTVGIIRKSYFLKKRREEEEVLTNENPHLSPFFFHPLHSPKI